MIEKSKNKTKKLIVQGCDLYVENRGKKTIHIQIKKESDSQSDK